MNPSRVTNRIKLLDEHVSWLSAYVESRDKATPKSTQEALNRARRMMVILETVRNMQ